MMTRSQSRNTAITIPDNIRDRRQLMEYIGNTFGNAMARIARGYINNMEWDVPFRNILRSIQDNLNHVYNNVMDEPDRERVRLAMEGAQANEGRLGNINIAEAARQRNPIEIGVGANGDISKSLIILQHHEHI